ncbi:hypothetical protein M5689_022387 [Euphorbia peplus]|nr:hypothetical protein M5689_022387 [Euphorbia peplus]
MCDLFKSEFFRLLTLDADRYLPTLTQRVRVLKFSHLYGKKFPHSRPVSLNQNDIRSIEGCFATAADFRFNNLG